MDAKHIPDSASLGLAPQGPTAVCLAPKPPAAQTSYSVNVPDWQSAASCQAGAQHRLCMQLALPRLAVHWRTMQPHTCSCWAMASEAGMRYRDLCRGTSGAGARSTWPARSRSARELTNSASLHAASVEEILNLMWALMPDGQHAHSQGADKVCQPVQGQYVSQLLGSMQQTGQAGA